MQLSRQEETFLRRWMHYQEGIGAAKRLQLQHQAVPADLATLIAATIPDPAEQEAAGLGPLPEPPVWPWSAESLRSRLVEARAVLAARSKRQDLQQPEPQRAP